MIDVEKEYIDMRMKKRPTDIYGNVSKLPKIYSNTSPTAEMDQMINEANFAINMQSQKNRHYVKSRLSEMKSKRLNTF